MGSPLEKLVQMSNKYGKDSRYVLAGGGNTSYKDEKFLYVKGSGTALATIQAENFVVMYRDRLDEMLTKTYSADDTTREREVLADMMNARLETEYHKRPSVEAILHNLFRQSYVLHLHPALVNGLTCGQNGKALTEEIFGGKAIWVDLEKPGYLLSAACYASLNAYRAAKGCEPQIVLLENQRNHRGVDTD